MLLLLLLLATALALQESTLSEFKTGNNLLTSDIYNELNKIYDENFLVSPFSLETILGLTLSGAKDLTAEELRTSLRLPEKTEEFISNLLSQLKSSQYTLDSANKIYIKDKFLIYDDFRKTTVDKYQSEIQNINFDKKEDAVKEINNWVENETHKKIKNILSVDDINEDSRLVLINALYFKGNWSVPFNLLKTVKKDFFTKEKEAVAVETMHVTDDFNYYECTEVDAKFLELPFIGEDASMVIVLPNKRNGIFTLHEKIDKVFTPRNFKQEYVKVALPKFKVETTIDFVDILKKLGVHKAFNGSEADLSGISGKKGELEISIIRQKTFIDVKEGGVEAAAATLVHIPTLISALPQIPRESKEFIVDHPFIFAIKIRGVVLFGGKVGRPEF